MEASSSASSSANPMMERNPIAAQEPYPDDDSDSSVLYDDVDDDSDVEDKDDSDSSEEESLCSEQVVVSRFTQARDSVLVADSKKKNGKRSTQQDQRKKTLDDSHTTSTMSTTLTSSDELLFSDQSSLQMGSSSVQFDQVREREFRMTLGSHPDAESVPVQLSWSILGKSQRYSLDDYEARKHVRNPLGLQKVPPATRNWIALRNHTTQAILNTLESMKLIRRHRQESMHDPQVRGINFFRSKNKNKNKGGTKQNKKKRGSKSSSTGEDEDYVSGSTDAGNDHPDQEQFPKDADDASLEFPVSPRKTTAIAHQVGRGNRAQTTAPAPPLAAQSDSSRWK